MGRTLLPPSSGLCFWMALSARSGQTRPAYTGAGARGFKRGLHSKPDGRWRTCGFSKSFKTFFFLCFFFSFFPPLLSLFGGCLFQNLLYAPRLPSHSRGEVSECFWGEFNSYVSVGREDVLCVRLGNVSLIERLRSKNRKVEAFY